VGKIGRREETWGRCFVLDQSGRSAEMLMEETDGINTEVAGWGLAQQRAKQKAFVTLLAIAPSPAF
jgi:hypothetical protein